MKHLVMGAGATIAEAQALGVAREDWPPVMSNFARKTWSNYTPYPILEMYLRKLGHDSIGQDPRDLFYQLESLGEVNVEAFMEFLWENRNVKVEVDTEKPFPPGFISGFRVATPGGAAQDGNAQGFWADFSWHGLGLPLTILISQCFHENGKGWKDLKLSKLVAEKLSDDDLVLNLNYDTIFEIALVQAGREFSYSPNVGKGALSVCKPHGSLNLVSNNAGFVFGQPIWLGSPQPPGYESYSGLVPPRLNKKYAQHRISRAIVAPVINRRPTSIIMWGLGLTESDEDLLGLYTGWSESVTLVDVVNPDADVANKVQRLFSCDVRHFADILEWLKA